MQRAATQNPSATARPLSAITNDFPLNLRLPGVLEEAHAALSVKRYQRTSMCGPKRYETTRKHVVQAPDRHRQFWERASQAQTSLCWIRHAFSMFRIKRTLFRNHMSYAHFNRDGGTDKAVRHRRHDPETLKFVCCRSAIVGAASSFELCSATRPHHEPLSSPVAAFVSPKRLYYSFLEGARFLTISA